jgi:SAM-dependent methyltransferase
MVAFVSDPTGLGFKGEKGGSLLGRAAARAKALVRRATSGDAATVLDALYRGMLQRPPDANAVRDFLPLLRSGVLSPEEIGRRIAESDEFARHMVSGDLGRSLHKSRCDFVRSLPKASRILDLGGTNLLHDYGALVTMGYPYDFEEIVIVDLPHDERHANYRIGEKNDVVDSGRGMVRYFYHSMTDLSCFENDSFDLVYSGQSIEHVDVADAELTLKEVHRVLRPGGHLALDTPNARLTRLQQESFIDPDHKYEYTVDEMRHKLLAAGFEVLEEKGLNLGMGSLASGKFSPDEIAANCGVFAEARDCYLMAFLCLKPC